MFAGWVDIPVIVTCTLLLFSRNLLHSSERSQGFSIRMPDEMESPQAVAGCIICCSRIMSLNSESQEARVPISSCSHGQALSHTNPSRSFLLILFYLFMLNIRFSESLTSHEGKDSVSTISDAPCWQVEQFLVAESCKECTRFEVKTREACSRTGFVEKVNCSESQREEYKSCRSTLMEETLFWRFEGTMFTLSVIFAVLVIHRQRALDRLASEKVRRQIESI